MMEKDLSSPLVTLVDEGAVGGVSNTHFNGDQPMQRGEVVAQHVSEIEVVHDDRGDPGEDVITGEEDASAAVAKRYVGWFVAGSVHHMEVPTVTEVDGVTVANQMVGRLDQRHEVGALDVCRGVGDRIWYSVS